jgi:hypothetical protein
MNELCAVMTTIPERRDVLFRTMVSAQAAGLQGIRVFEQADPTRNGNAHRCNAINAINSGIHSGVRHVLYLEDDIEFASWFTSALKEAAASDSDVVTFYNPGRSFYPASIRRCIDANQPIHRGMYRLSGKSGFFGSQALLLSKEFAERVLTGWTSGNFDRRVAEIAGDIMLYAPNPVQHYGACLRSTWSPYGRSHRSITYVP